MATNAENSKALDLESVEASQSEEEIREAAQTDKVVRGVNGGLAPKARKLRPLAGLIIIALVVLNGGIHAAWSGEPEQEGREAVGRGEDRRRPCNNSREGHVVGPGAERA